MQKKILISAPHFYGIDEAIRDSWEFQGYQAILKNYRTQSTVQEKISRRLTIKFPFTGPIFNPLLKYYLNLENAEFLKMIRDEKPDLLFVIKGDHLYPETLRIIRDDMQIPVVAYIWDDPFYSYAGLYADQYRKYNFEKGMHLYDYIFVYDPYYVEEIKKRGVTNTEYLPLAGDPKRYKDIPISEEDRNAFGYDVCFVGVPYPNRIIVLESLKKYRLGVFGDGWEKYFLRRGKKVPSYYRGKAEGEKVLKIYRASKIVLNIHDPEAKEGVNTRTFDILACGASELVDYKKSLETHFIVGEEIAVYKNIEELKSLVELYLHDPDLIGRISQKGRQRVLNEHTWIHRTNEVVSTLKNHHILKSK
jgi:spore maturation protein CgeB